MSDIRWIYRGSSVGWLPAGPMVSSCHACDHSLCMKHPQITPCLPPPRPGRAHHLLLLLCPALSPLSVCLSAPGLATCIHRSINHQYFTMLHLPLACMSVFSWANILIGVGGVSGGVRAGCVRPLPASVPSWPGDNVGPPPGPTRQAGSVFTPTAPATGHISGGSTHLTPCVPTVRVPQAGSSHKHH